MVAKLLVTQYGGSSVRQVDRLRMTGIRANDRIANSDLNKYMMIRSWLCVITSEYALRQLGTIADGHCIRKLRAYDGKGWKED
ncbi:uncharacterized protein PHALS_06040 [Plasmopara halstedii]|uniref:Uncharacterized protein n=1 Tax=Plasmopara halstedii TaxID=4781 RepID=A0A0P1ACC6_PLAHL|nr:uncharacterized protein PHALS_06040 [Plasmopara halstedii]CEG37996.1 hypothetical protein PHALS_06040 [Plasmopara halstedii]|eukprot:XP_024574365.1 hypothetical protein PHALS_06040 [Plasmopara halstedii]